MHRRFMRTAAALEVIFGGILPMKYQLLCAAACLTLLACSEVGENASSEHAANDTIVVDEAPAAPAASASITSAEGMQEITSGASTQGVVLARAIWRNPVIPVCWESMDAAGADGRRWTQAAIEGSWENVSRVDFTGWGQCAASSRGVRIQVADAGAHTLGLGNQLDGKRNGMRLNFTLAAWNAGCRQNSGLEACVRMVGIHEFGHALGLAHEQNRPETAEVAGDECAGRRQGTPGDTPLTPWDRESVMNYCNPVYGNAGRLSRGDIVTVQRAYGLPDR